MLVTIIASIVAFGLLIFFHELGHFLMAKKVGIRVEKFSLGFGPELIGFTKGDTRYCLSAIPFGGFVKMSGENDITKTLPWDFNAKSVWERILVVFFGPFFNFILAFLLFTIVFMAGVASVDVNSTVIGKVSEGYPAQAAGLRTGDQILEINDTKMNGWQDVQGTIQKNIDNGIKIKILREGKQQEFNVVSKMDSKDKRKIIGIGPKETMKKMNFFEAAWEGLTHTFILSWVILKGLFLVIFGKVKADIAGPVGIVQMLGSQASYGITSLLYFIGFLSVNLGIINLFPLPIPILDGGVILFLIIEKITGKPLSEKNRQLLEQVGIALLLALMVYATFKDIIRIRAPWK